MTSRAGLILCLVVLLLPGSSFGFECKRSDIEPFALLRWPSRQVDVGVASGPRIDLQTVRDAVSAWTDVACSDFELNFIGAVSEDRLPPAGVAFVDGGWARNEAGVARPLDAVGLTTTVFDRFNGDIVSAIVEVNRERFVVESDPRCAVGQARGYDLQSVLTHELGHLLGFDHTLDLSGASSDPTMAPTISPCETDKRSLEGDDRSGLCALYPAGRATGSCVAPSTNGGGLAAGARPVDNTAFGCRSRGPLPRGGASSLWLPFLAAGVLLAVRRRSCSRSPSAG